MAYRRRPSPAAGTFWFLFCCCFIVGAIQSGQAWLGVVVGAFLLIAIWPRRPVVRSGTTPTVQPVQRAGPAVSRQPRYRTTCAHCGGPQRHGAMSCRFCGHSLAAG